MALVAVQASLLAEQETSIEVMLLELAVLRRAAGRDSSNSSAPPSQDGPASQVKAKAAKRSVAAASGADPDQHQLGTDEGVSEDGTGAGAGGAGAGGAGAGGAAKRKQGGQPGHRSRVGSRGIGVVDWRGWRRRTGSNRSSRLRAVVAAPAWPAPKGRWRPTFRWGHRPLRSSGGVDLPSIALEVTEYLTMKRVCACGRATTADLPAGARGGPVCYGPQVAAALTWLASQDVIGVERAAQMMSSLLGAGVSTGYVSACLARLDAALDAAGFEEELKAALCESPVLGTDETGADISNPHVFTARTMRECTGGGSDLVWFGAAGTRTRKEITAFGILDNYAGVLVRDDFGGYVSYDEDLAGVQQCLSHILRYLQDTIDIDPAEQVWATQAAEVLRRAIHAFNTARRNATPIDAEKITAARKEYDQAVACGISINTSRPWPKGNHPGLVLARRLKREADQVWLGAPPAA